MANDTRPRCKAKHDENNNSRRGQTSGKGLSTLGSPCLDKSALRRSTRETLSKEEKVVPSPSKIRKSERLEKLMPTPPGTEKSERVEEKCMRSPLRRSDRARKPSSSSSFGSKGSDKCSSSSSLKQKNRQKEIIVKQLTLDTRKLSKRGKKDGEPVHVKPKTMSARAYKALFMKKTKRVKVADHGEKHNRESKFSHGHSNSCGGESDGVDECTERRADTLIGEYGKSACERTFVGSDYGVSNSANETLQDKGGVMESSHSSLKPGCKNEAHESEDGDSSNAMSKEISDENGLEKSRSLELMVSSFNGKAPDNKIGFESGKEIISSKRRWNLGNVDSDELVKTQSQNNCTSIADAISSLPIECSRGVETSGACYKRQRVDFDPAKLDLSSCKRNSNPELHVAAVVKRKESPTALRKGGDQNTCLICKRGGMLLCCDGRGCKRNYHLSCLDPPMADVPFGDWYCLTCVMKKIKSGVHSVSEGVESILDAREVKASDVDGLQKQEFFVKYKGLAHIHNNWVPESKLLLDAPSLVARFNRQSQVHKSQVRWKQEWTVPHRLLQKRLLLSPKQCDQYLKENAGNMFDCHYEWLVKWRGLGYEHATWELENSSLFNLPHGQSLIREYENRRKENKILENEKRPSAKLSKLSVEISTKFDNNHLDYINKLRELWHKGQNAVAIDEQERIKKVVGFILSLQSDACQPFLIITTPAALSSWDDEFFQMVPSTSVVVYKGDKDLRKTIRALEFHVEGGCIRFQVLITTAEVFIEDLDVLECIGWEVIVIDECQRSRISSHYTQIKILSTKMRLLVLGCQLKEGSSADYLTFLSLLDSHNVLDKSIPLQSSSSDNIGKLKERLSRYIVYECKSESSRFKEYWVPVQMSTVQLEQYCGALISNSNLLRSFQKKNDLLGSLHDVLVSLQKCCDHPYIMDKSVQLSLSKGLEGFECLDVGVKASAKLQLLDMMLLEIKKRGLRVLILFQSSSGPGMTSLGDILDDVLRQRFGSDCYERVEGVVLPSKKQAALNMFNDKEHGRFVFLLETHACNSSIKLSSVDAVIIYGSEWSPVNDVRALQKITLDSQFDQIKVFRLYSSYTVEEKVLILSKQEKILDSKLQNISRNTSHMLLMWGASHQFETLDRFHGGNGPLSIADISSDESHLKDVFQDFSSILPLNGKDGGSGNPSIILNVQQVGGAYSTDSSLLGERQSQLMDEGQPHIFWTKLLEGKHPLWKYSSGSSQRIRKRVKISSGSSQRIRKRVKIYGEVPKNQEAQDDEVVKKRTKVVNSCVEPSCLELGSHKKLIAGDKEGASETPADNLPYSVPRSSCINETFHANYASTSPKSGLKFIEFTETRTLDFVERMKSLDAQKSLHFHLKPDVSKLCEILRFSDPVKGTVEKFLEYVMNNHHVNTEPATLLQGFQISLCWTVASMQNQKVDHKESLELAKQHLNFKCKKEEADYAYSLLRCLKRMFRHHLKVQESAKVEGCKNKDHTGKQVHSLSRLAPEFKLAEKDVSKSIKEIQKKCQRQLTKLLQRQQEEKNELVREYEEEKANLQNRQMMAAAVIRKVLQNNVSLMTDRLKLLDGEYVKKFEEHKKQMDMALKDLEVEQLATRNKVQDKEAVWVEEVMSWARAELFCIQLGNSTDGHIRVHDDPENLTPVAVHLSDERSPDQVVHSTLGTRIGLSGTSENVLSEGVEFGHSVKTLTPQVRPVNVNYELGIMASKENKIGYSSDDPERIASMDPCMRDQVPDGAASRRPDDKVLPEVPAILSSCDGSEKVISRDPPSCEDHSHGEATLTMPGREVIWKNGVNVSSSNGTGVVHPLTFPSSEELNSDASALSRPDEDVVSVNQPASEEVCPDGVVIQKDSIDVSSSDGPGEIIPLTLPSSEELNPDVSALSRPDEDVSVNPPASVETCPDGEVLLKDGVDVSSSDGQGEIHTLTPLSEELNPDVSAFSRPDDVVLSVNPPASEAIYPDGEVMAKDGVNVSSSDGPQEIHTLTPPPPEELNLDVSALRRPDEDVSVNPPASEEICPVMTASAPDNEVQLKVPDSVSSNDCLEYLVPVNPPSSEEQILDTITVSMPDKEIQQGIPMHPSSSDVVVTVVSANPVSSAEKLLEGATLSMSDGESFLPVQETAHDQVEVDNTSSGNGEMHVTASDNATAFGQRDGVLNPIDQNSLLQEQSLVQQDEHIIPSTPCGMEVGDAPASEKQNASQEIGCSVSQTNEAEPSNHSDQEALTFETAVQIQLFPSSSSPSGLNLLDQPSVAEIECQPTSGEHTSNQVSQAPVLPVEDPAELSNQGVLQSMTSFPLHPPVDVPAGGVGVHVIDTRTTLQAPPQLAADPLQIELERLRKEIDDTVKIYEERNQHLKTDCEKELEEAAAQIRAKYEIKHRETETEFLLRKKELDSNYNKVWMNKILATAFHMKLDLNFSATQHIFSMRQNARQSSLAVNTSVASPSAPNLQASVPSPASNLQNIQPAPASNLQASAPNLQSIPHAAAPNLQSSAPAPASNLQTNPLIPAPNLQTNPLVPAPNLQTIPPAPGISTYPLSPPLQNVPHSSALFPSTMARPPHISSLSSTINVQGMGEIRAPAPHLQPFRSLTPGAAATNCPPPHLRGMLSQQASTNPTATSHAIPHLSPRLPSSTHQSGPCNGAPRPSYLNALDLLMDVDGYAGTCLPSSLPSQPNSISNIDQSSPSDSGIRSTQVNQACAGDLVCLSDDD
ncbi:hypothetical protein FNV43_RR05424 [Rhamnella rubrinervis]|uniref:Uncharacterized protein n=1 Tax=Rhamnella rubrinervis TaxID=2594499 RepID=A0A8K0HM23_9ROSA|nr:hypothetical protein FNV43_RR05424 [Rhamnella rubrinervis]